MATMEVSTVTPYTVSNTIIFGLAHGTTTSPITDEFSVSGTVVPEPSTWAMMLLGFAGLAFSGYRRARAGHATLALDCTDWRQSPTIGLRSRVDELSDPDLKVLIFKPRPRRL